jgi:UDP-N-acetylmuramate: L-alanyl-gamma-D-glutamyl-meso-diaminopimelate ligase
MRIHFIAIGGSAMHNLALALDNKGYTVTGSDDEIYEPSLSRLRSANICPPKFGWFPNSINDDIDVVILGMHAKKDNPELLKAQDVGLKIMSYPEFVYDQSKDKKRVVIAGSHGKTTTTSMVIHVLKEVGIKCDYLVGALLDGFDRMVKLSENPLIILEGDEYLSSPIDRRSKFSHYDPDISVITGISWDHINVFPTEQAYKFRFKEFIASHDGDGTIYYCDKDESLVGLINDSNTEAFKIGYGRLTRNDQGGVRYGGEDYEFNLIGGHNLENAHAALLVCKKLGVHVDDYFEALLTFTGAKKRLQKIFETKDNIGFLDFAHAPSKVKATSEAIKEWYPQFKQLAVLELHTFSSLNKAFIPQYKDTLNPAEEAVVFYDQHTLEMKGMPPISKDFILESFNHDNLLVFDNVEDFHNYLDGIDLTQKALILMSSGTLGKYDLNTLNRW